MITAVRIQNLRSLADTGFIEIRPITMLLGANSTGKSTFLRSFPLFTQSVKKKLRGPISWFDDSMVDFGDYKTALNRFAPEGETIRFAYRIQRPFRKIFWTPVYELYGLPILKSFKELLFSLSLKNDDAGTYINAVTIGINGVTVGVEMAQRGDGLQFYVDGQEVDLKQTVKWEISSYNNILPCFEFPTRDHTFLVHDSIKRVVKEQVVAFVSTRCPKIQKVARADQLINGWKANKAEYLTWLQNQSPLVSFKRYTAQWTADSPEFLELYHLIALEKVLSLWEIIDMEISQFYRSCSYIAPARAEANRYYRTQGLQVNDIDPYGKNLAEFISSLKPEMLKSYNQYTKGILGVKVKTKAETGHQCIMLSNKNGEFNISDVGFGYSQILPVITKLWFAAQHIVGRMAEYEYTEEPLDRIILMEQPELHLHPAYQAKIADAFIASVKENEARKTRHRLMVETHSDTILNRIGRRVREGVLKADEVNIVLFDKEVGGTVTRVHQTAYNEKGQIMEWPFGFFDPFDD